MQSKFARTNFHLPITLAFSHQSNYENIGNYGSIMNYIPLFFSFPLYTWFPEPLCAIWGKLAIHACYKTVYLFSCVFYYTIHSINRPKKFWAEMHKVEWLKKVTGAENLLVINKIHNWEKKMLGKLCHQDASLLTFPSQIFNCMMHPFSLIPKTFQCLLIWVFGFMEFWINEKIKFLE